MGSSKCSALPCRLLTLMESTLVLFRSVGVRFGLIGEPESAGAEVRMDFVSSIRYTKRVGVGYE